jgi:hypothetical protein
MKELTLTFAALLLGEALACVLTVVLLVRRHLRRDVGKLPRVGRPPPNSAPSIKGRAGAATSPGWAPGARTGHARLCRHQRPGGGDRHLCYLQWSAISGFAKDLAGKIGEGHHTAATQSEPSGSHDGQIPLPGCAELLRNAPVHVA